MYVETDFLTALVKDEDWLREPALPPIEDREDVHTSILAYAEVLVLFYDREQSEYEVDAPRAITNLLELVPIQPEEHEDSVLAAAAFLDDYGMTPFHALHAGLVATGSGTVLSSEQAYESVGLDRLPLETHTEN